MKILGNALLCIDFKIQVLTNALVRVDAKP